MREHDRGGHQFFRVVAGKPEHQPLIARALFGGLFPFRFLRIDALRDVVRLIGDDGVDENFARVKNVVVVHVANFAHGIADDFVDRNDVLELRSFFRFGIVISPPTMTTLLLA